MAYTDDAVQAKLSALNETQESIVTVAQWIMFHRRHANRTAQLWMQRLQDSTPSKRLNLIYLANEVVQQSKARRKEDFLTAFSPIIATAIACAHKGATNEVQQKLRRVIEVWKQRQIFEQNVQDRVEACLLNTGKDRSSSKKPPLGGSLYSSSLTDEPAPRELDALIRLQKQLAVAEIASKPAASAATSEYERLHSPSQPPPYLPVHAAKLSSLLKLLAKAEDAVNESMRTRQDLIDTLEQLLRTNRAVADVEGLQQSQIVNLRVTVEREKDAIESAISHGVSGTEIPYSPENAPDKDHNGSADATASIAVPEHITESFDAEVPVRPQVEALTPPPVESFTPPFEISGMLAGSIPTNSVAAEDVHTSLLGPIYSTDPRLRPQAGTSNLQAGNSGLFSPSLPSSAKRRRVSRDHEEFSYFGKEENAMEGLDDDVVGMLG